MAIFKRLSIHHTCTSHVNFGGNRVILHNICDPNYFTSINSSCVHSMKFSVTSVSMATYSNIINMGTVGCHLKIHQQLKNVELDMEGDQS